MPESLWSLLTSMIPCRTTSLLRLKYDLGKLPLPVPPADYVPSRLALTATSPLSITAVHALRLAALPPHHRDPFDRMLIVQALTDGLSLVTSDRTLRKYGAELIPAWA